MSDNPYAMAALPWGELKRTLPDGNSIELMPLTFGRVRLVLNPPGEQPLCYLEGW